MRIDVRYGGTRAYYAPGPDRIQMPPFETFKSASAFWSTLAHEHVHASGAKSRWIASSVRTAPPSTPARSSWRNSAARSCAADLGIASAPRADHASYIASWLKLLEDEPRAVFDAATQAQQAVEFLHALHDVNASGAAA